MDVTPDLRAVSNDLLDALDVLEDLETEKRQTAIGSPRFVDLARRIEELANEIFESSREQTDLAEDSLEGRREGRLAGPPTIEAAETRAVAVILSEWREAERGRAAAEPGSATERRFAEAADRLRSEYQDAARRGRESRA